MTYEGEKSAFLYIIKEGEFEVLKKIHKTSKKEHKIKEMKE